MASRDLDDLEQALADQLRLTEPECDVARARWRTLTTAILCEAFRRRGMVATLVGGGAIEFHAPGSYATDDTDLIVEGPRRESLRAEVERVFFDLRFAKRGRHWVREKLFVEVPGASMEDPVHECTIGGYDLRVVKPEVVLAERIVGFKHWGYTAYGLQSIAMVAAFGSEIDEDWLYSRLEREDAVDAYLALRALEAASQPITDAELRAVLERLKSNRNDESGPATVERSQ